MPKNTFDYVELACKIENMTSKQTIFKVLKQHLGLKGYWKNKARGNPSKGGYAKYRKEEIE